MTLPPLFAARLASPQFAGSGVQFSTGFPGCGSLSEVQRRNRREQCNAADLEKALFLLLAELLQRTPDQDLFPGGRPAGVAAGCALQLVSFLPEPDPGFLSALFLCSFWGKERSSVLTGCSKLAGVLPLTDFITVSGSALSSSIVLSRLRFYRSGELIHQADDGNDAFAFRQFLEARFCLAPPGGSTL